MKRAIHALILLYPKKWRNRYKNEFDALLEDVSPTWRTLFDVFGGAMKMQLKTGNLWKTVAAFGLVGLFGAIAFLAVTPARYVSTAVILLDGQWNPSTASRMRGSEQKILSRSNLARLINEEDLYKRERTQDPLEDIIARMKSQDITLQPIKSVNDPQGVQAAFSVSFAAPDAAQAQRTTQRLAAAFVDAKVGILLDPASLPIHPRSPKRPWVVFVGLVTGVIAGAGFALFMKLKVWKLATALGIGCALLCAAGSFLLPERYTSTAVIHLDSKDPAAAAIRAGRLIAVVQSNANLDFIAKQFRLFPNSVDAPTKMREHLSIQSIQNSTAFTITFDYDDRFVAQKVVQEVVSRLIDEAIRARVDESEREGAEGLRRGETLELLDPASLPLNPHFPNRAMIAGTGLCAGVALAVALGIRRRTIAQAV
jgi:uncharacterized protein involved in exopolysaccharide biosynthesis